MTRNLTQPLKKIFTWMDGAFPLRESTPFLRTFTGAVFGFSLAFLVYPHIAEGMKDTERRLHAKLSRIGELP